MGWQLALGAAAVSLAEVTHLAFLSGVKHSDPIVFYPAVTLAAVAGRAPAAMLATAISIVAIECHRIIAPQGEGVDTIISFDGLTFVFGCIFIIAIIEALHRAIAGRERVEAALRARETRLKAIVNGVADGILTTDEKGVIEQINPPERALFR